MQERSKIRKESTNIILDLFDRYKQGERVEIKRQTLNRVCEFPTVQLVLTNDLITFNSAAMRLLGIRTFVKFYIDNDAIFIRCSNKNNGGFNLKVYTRNSKGAHFSSVILSNFLKKIYNTNSNSITFKIDKEAGDFDFRLVLLKDKNV